MKTYNVGILGFGFIGKVHAYGYLNLPFFYDPVPLHARITHVANDVSISICLQAIADGRPAEPDLTQGIRVQRMMDRVRRSAAERCWIEW
jgi:predicted dehydrogenase